jgi:hypothetical protein
VEKPSTVHTEQWRRELKKKKWRRRKKKEEGRTCGGFEAMMLAVADRRMAWPVVGPSSSFLHIFLLCFSSLFLFSSSISHGAGAIIDDEEDNGSWRWL